VYPVVLQFPDVDLDCPDVLVPTPGMKIRPRPALRRLFASVAVDLSRNYFDPFVDKLAQRVQSAGGGISAASPHRRITSSSSSASSSGGLSDAESAEGFWRAAFGGVEQCSWLAFEGALRSFLADDPATLAAVLAPLEGAVCDHRGGRGGGGTVSFGALAATFAGGNFKDTLRAMAAEASAAELVFDIVVRVQQGNSKEYVVDEDQSTSFVMVKSSDTLSRVRQTIVEAFTGDDYGASGQDAESDAGLEFLGEGNFSFVFQVGAGHSGKAAGASHWAKARRQQERRVTAAGLTNLSVVEDDTAATTERRWARVKSSRARAGGSLHSGDAGSERGYGSGSEGGGEEDDLAGLAPFGEVQMVTNPVAFALAAGVLHQAKVRAAEALTAADALGDDTLATALGAAMAARGGSEQAAMICLAAAEVKANPSSAEARADLVAALPDELGAAVAAGGASAAEAAANAALMAAADLAAPLADLKAKLLRAHRGKSARSDGLGGKRERVVILGGGFAGCTAAAKLDRNPQLHVTLVDTKE
jgi:hypothetical protein